jgi:type II secretory pathway component GspD/PulD (secretin)
MKNILIILFALIACQQCFPIEPKEDGGTKHRSWNDTISVDFPDEDIRTIIRNAADLYRLNVIIPDSLTGNTSLKLKDVTWRDIFDVALRDSGYTYSIKGSTGNLIEIVEDRKGIEKFSLYTMSLTAWLLVASIVTNILLATVILMTLRNTRASDKIIK